MAHPTYKVRMLRKQKLMTTFVDTFHLLDEARQFANRVARGCNDNRVQVDVVDSAGSLVGYFLGTDPEAWCSTFRPVRS